MDDFEKAKFDRSFVNMQDEGEREYWRQNFRTSLRGLSLAIKAVGNYVPQLREYFRRTRRRKR
jgi:hypothetical protein